ncbi:MAG: nitroreductase [Chloroflexota bacterium]
MDLLTGIETRRSVRAFTSVPIPRETLEAVLQAAGKSPSYTNTQPWEVAIVTGRKKDELSGTLYEMARVGTPANPDLPLPKQWPSALEDRAKEHGARRLQALGVQRDDQQTREELRLQNFRFYGAPCVLFLFMDSSLTSWSIFDMGLFAQTLILAAHSFGLGSCLQASIANYPDAVREALELPENKLIIIGISLGYPDLEAQINSYQSSRISTSSFVRWFQ